MNTSSEGLLLTADTSTVRAADLGSVFQRVNNYNRRAPAPAPAPAAPTLTRAAPVSTLRSDRQGANAGSPLHHHHHHDHHTRHRRHQYDHHDTHQYSDGGGGGGGNGGGRTQQKQHRHYAHHQAAGGRDRGTVGGGRGGREEGNGDRDSKGTVRHHHYRHYHHEESLAPHALLSREGVGSDRRTSPGQQQQQYYTGGRGDGGAEDHRYSNIESPRSRGTHRRNAYEEESATRRRLKMLLDHDIDDDLYYDDDDDNDGRRGGNGGGDHEKKTQAEINASFRRTVFIVGAICIVAAIGIICLLASSGDGNPIRGLHRLLFGTKDTDDSVDTDMSNGGLQPEEGHNYAPGTASSSSSFISGRDRNAHTRHNTDHASEGGEGGGDIMPTVLPNTAIVDHGAPTDAAPNYYGNYTPYEEEHRRYKHRQEQERQQWQQAQEQEQEQQREHALHQEQELSSSSSLYYDDESPDSEMGGGTPVLLPPASGNSRLDAFPMPSPSSDLQQQHQQQQHQQHQQHQQPQQRYYESPPLTSRPENQLPTSVPASLVPGAENRSREDMAREIPLPNMGDDVTRIYGHRGSSSLLGEGRALYESSGGAEAERYMGMSQPPEYDPSTDPTLNQEENAKKSMMALYNGHQHKMDSNYGVHLPQQQQPLPKRLPQKRSDTQPLSQIRSADENYGNAQNKQKHIAAQSQVAVNSIYSKKQQQRSAQAAFVHDPDTTNGMEYMNVHTQTYLGEEDR